MADITVLTATAREQVGKGSAREARRQGNIPAVIYGDKKSPIPIILEPVSYTHLTLPTIYSV